MLETDIAYFAGLFDGEGTLSIQMQIRDHKGKESAHFNPRMTMSLYWRREVLEDLASAFGGKVYYNKSKSGDGTEGRWNLSKMADLKPAVETILPYLRIKKDIAMRFLEALSYFPKKRADHLHGERSWDVERTLKVAEIALSLNDYKKSPKTMEFLERLRAIYANDDLRTAYDRRVDVSPTHCKHGHEWTPDNTYLNKRGTRICRACGRDSNKRRKKAVSVTHMA